VLVSTVDQFVAQFLPHTDQNEADSFSRTIAVDKIREAINGPVLHIEARGNLDFLHGVVARDLPGHPPSKVFQVRLKKVHVGNVIGGVRGVNEVARTKKERASRPALSSSR
jgi:hypothetical protein